MAEKNFYTREADKVADHFDVDPDSGLSKEEVEKRRKEHGPNKLKEKKQKSLWQLLLDQLKSAVIYLLTAAVIVSFIFGDVPEAIAIIVVIVFNTAIGFYMEFQARKSMQALQEMDKMTTKVLRNGEEEEIDAEDLVPGDIIILGAGNLIPADARIFEAAELQINESALTGESVPITKQTDTVEEDAQLGDRKNMAYKGTSITMGKGKAIVTATGMETEIGGISAMVAGEEKESVPLNQKLNKLSKRLIWIVLGMAATYGIIGYFTGKGLHIIAQTSIAWAIAAIPEGLAIVSTIALAKGMMRLAKDQVIVKKLAAVETLGETTVILTDKTGTLTENKLSVSQFYFDKERKKEENLEEFPEEDSLFEKIMKVSLLCNNAELKEDGGKGDMLEIAILQYAEELKEGITKEYREKYERVEEDPFDSDSMMMSTLHKENGGFFSAVKGAASAILERCNKVLTEEGEKDLSEEDKKKWDEESDAMAADGLRTIALAFKKTDQKEGFDEDLTLLGLVGFLDPPREDVKEAIKICLQAGMHVVMVTGDHPETARNIAKQVHILDDDADSSAYIGKDVEGYDDKSEEEKKKFANSRVFARVDPGQKLDILKVFQESGEIVGMTGDGVNDAPALKKADIGIAMGKRGTQVAKEVSDMVLKNDDFPSIITAIRQGRILFNNIRKFIVYQLSYHLSEILVIAAVSFTIFTLPLRPLQLLFLNLLTDVFPALALGIGKGRGKVMEEKPKAPDEPILTKKSWTMISVYGAIIAAYTIGAYFFATYSMGVSKEIANNVAFFGLAFTQVFHVFDMRDNDEPVFVNQVTKNKYVWMAVAFCTAVLIAAYFIPGLNTLLDFQKMAMEEWLLVIATAIVSIGTIQLLKGFKVIA